MDMVLWWGEGLLVSVEGFLDDGEGAAGLGLHGFQPLRLDVFLKERRDLGMKLYAEVAQSGNVIVGGDRLLVLRMLEGRSCHSDVVVTGSISGGFDRTSRPRSQLSNCEYSLASCPGRTQVSISRTWVQSYAESLPERRTGAPFISWSSLNPQIIVAIQHRRSNDVASIERIN